MDFRRRISRRTLSFGSYPFSKRRGRAGEVTDIASVSGGSVLAAHPALNWNRYLGDDESFDAAALELVKFLQFDVCNHIVRRLSLQAPLKLLAKLHLQNSKSLKPNAILERYYRDRLYGERVGVSNCSAVRGRHAVEWLFAHQ